VIANGGSSLRANELVFQGAVDASSTGCGWRTRLPEHSRRRAARRRCKRFYGGGADDSDFPLWPMSIAASQVERILQAGMGRTRRRRRPRRRRSLQPVA
jgi:hypothetical protein